MPKGKHENPGRPVGEGGVGLAVAPTARSAVSPSVPHCLWARGLAFWVPAGLHQKSS